VKSVLLRSAGYLLVAAATSVFASAAGAGKIKAKLSGAQEVPPVTTTATGTAHFEVKDDMSVSGSVKTEGVKATAAHIHEDAPGTTGGVAVPLTAKGENERVVPKDAKFTAAQMAELKAGNSTSTCTAPHTRTVRSALN
jgi:hypothetical protein